MSYIVALLIALFFIIIYSAFSWGYVLNVMYYWFILPAMPTLPHFTTLQFVGISLFVNALIRSNYSSNKEDDKNNIVFGLLLPWITLGISWMIHGLFF